MKKTRLIWNQLYCYRTIEEKLERYASQGLFFTKVGLFGYQFEKREPKKVRYCLAFFEEASAFSKTPTENQQSLIALAAASGWQFLSQNGRTQYFMNEEEHPVPFETDQKEKLRNIKQCMKKDFVPYRISFIVFFLLQLSHYISLAQSSPGTVYSTNLFLICFPTFFVFILGNLFYLADYYQWCKASEASIAQGGGCLETKRTCTSAMDIVTQVSALGILLYAVVLLLPMPFHTSFERTGNWPYRMSMFGTQTKTPKLQKDPLPLIYEDLYATTGEDLYSYEAQEEKGIFLERNQYEQISYANGTHDTLLSYTIYTPKADFVKTAVAEELRQEDKWHLATRTPLDNALFGTVEAYIDTFATDAAVTYTLFYERQMATITLPHAVTTEEVSRIKEQLGL